MEIITHNLDGGFFSHWAMQQCKWLFTTCWSPSRQEQNLATSPTSPRQWTAVGNTIFLGNVSSSMIITLLLSSEEDWSAWGLCSCFALRAFFQQYLCGPQRKFAEWSSIYYKFKSRLYGVNQCMERFFHPLKTFWSVLVIMNCESSKLWPEYPIVWIMIG